MVNNIFSLNRGFYRIILFFQFARLSPKIFVVRSLCYACSFLGLLPGTG
jgi:hypothetical protein